MDSADGEGPAVAPAPHHVPSGEEIVEERGVPVQDDWSIAPDDDKVRFSLSGVMPHSWGKRSKRQSNMLEGRGQGRGPGRGGGKGIGEERQEATCRGRAGFSSLSLLCSPDPEWLSPGGEGQAHPARGPAAAGVTRRPQLR